MAASSSAGGQIVLASSGASASDNSPTKRSTTGIRGLIDSAKSLFVRSNVGTIGAEEEPPEFDVFLPVYLAGIQILQPFDDGKCKILLPSRRYEINVFVAVPSA